MSTSQQRYSWEFRVASDLSIGWQRVMVVSIIRSVIDVTLHRALLALRWVTGIPPQYVTSQLGQLSLASLRGPKLITSSAGVTSGNVTSAKWQVMLCYSIWHVSCHSSEAGCKLLYCVTTLCVYCALPSVLWRCWLGGRKGIRPVKNWVVGCWHGYLSGARCRLAYGPADATATNCLLLH